ncbi:hypothetical protein U1Q18_021044 [Sarracenia purpurea var. burkii]
MEGKIDCLQLFNPEPNARAVPGGDGEPKIDVDDPKEDEFDEPKSDGEVLAPNAGVGTPNMEVVAGEVDPKWLDVDETSKGEEPKTGMEEDLKPVLPMGVLEANGLEDIEDEKGFTEDCPNVDKAAKGFDCILEAPNPIAPADWPAGAGPPEIKEKK